MQQRVLVARIGQGGVVLDLMGGRYARVADDVLLAAEAMERGEAVGGEAGEMLAEWLGSALPERDGSPSPSGWLRAAEDHDGWLIREGANDCGFVSERGVEGVDPEGRRICAPHYLALVGVPVLHASAVRIDGRAVVFVGPGGIGKTTTANRLGDVLCEDLAVLRESAVLAGAEDGIRLWAEGADMRPSPDGEPVPIAAVHIVQGRRGSGFASSPVEPEVAVGLLLRNAFAEIRDPRVYRTAFLAAVRAASAPCYATWLPDGIEHLDAAIARWDAVSGWVGGR